MFLLARLSVKFTDLDDTDDDDHHDDHATHGDAHDDDDHMGHDKSDVVSLDFNGQGLVKDDRVVLVWTCMWLNIIFDSFGLIWLENDI